MKFKVVIIYDPEYKGYVVDVPKLVGCMSQGKTIDEALDNIKDAIRGWLEVEKRHGRLEVFTRRQLRLDCYFRVKRSCKIVGPTCNSLPACQHIGL